MTVAVCTNCGSLKHGAWCSCPKCDSDGLDADLSMLLSDHNLSELELRRVSQAVQTIHETRLEEDVRFHALVYFLSRKWPKLLEFNAEEVEPSLQQTLDELYRNRLARIPGQETPILSVSPVRLQLWTKAWGEDCQREDDEWQKEVAGIVSQGFAIAERMGATLAEVGEGAVLPRLWFRVRTRFLGFDYRSYLAMLDVQRGDANSYSRHVDSFCDRVKNGWTDRTKQQASYFRGLCIHLENMADQLKKLVEHKGGVHTLIEMDARRAREEFEKSYKDFKNLSSVVVDPTQINPDGTCTLRNKVY